MTEKQNRNSVLNKTFKKRYRGRETGSKPTWTSGGSVEDYFPEP